MSKPLTLTLNFKRLADAELAKQAGMIGEGMNNNEYFPWAQPIAQNLKIMTDEYWKAISDAGTRDIVKAAFKNQYRERLIDIMRSLGMRVMMEAKGQDTQLLSSGFPVAKRGGLVNLVPPTVFRVYPGEASGEIILQINRVIGAKSYIYQYTPFPLTPQSVWETVHGTRCKVVLTGLTPGVQYCFRMGAIGARKQVVYSQVIIRYVWH